MAFDPASIQTFSITPALSAFGAGRDMRRQQNEAAYTNNQRTALAQAGGAAAKGNLQGARDVLFRAGNLGDAFAIDQNMQQQQAATTQADAAHQAEVQRGLANLALDPSVTDEQWAQAVTQFFSLHGDQEDIAALPGSPLLDPSIRRTLAAGAMDAADYYSRTTPSYDFQNVNGNLVRTDAQAGTATPVYKAPAAPADAPQHINAVGADGQTHIMGWNPQTNAFDQDLGIAPAGTPLVQNNGETALDARLGGAVGDIFAGMIEDGIQAMGDRAQIDRLGELLTQAGGGGLGTVLTQVAGNLGINLGDQTDAVQAAQAIIAYLIPRQRVPGSGTTSDFDARSFQQSLPQLINQPGGNQLIIETMRALAQYKIDQADIAMSVASGDLTMQQGLAQIKALPDPFAAARAAGAIPTQQQAPPATTPAAPAAPAPAGQTEIAPGIYFNPVPQR